MRKFLLKSVLVVLPIFLFIILIELCLRSIPNDYTFKNDYLEENAGDLECLFLGNSHTFYGVNPEYIRTKSFNASHISQSLEYDYAIFMKYADKMTNLEYIVMPIDYFTMFIRLKDGNENWRIKNYEIYYDINESSRIEDRSELLSLKFSIGLKRAFDFLAQKEENAITCSALGYGNAIREQKSLTETGLSASKRHRVEDTKRFEESIAMLNDLIDYTKARDIKLILFTSPTYETYFKQLDDTQLYMTLDAITDLANKHPHCYYYNYLKDRDFVAVDFRDADHLNRTGAIKFSTKLNKLLIDLR